MLCCVQCSMLDATACPSPEHRQRGSSRIQCEVFPGLCFVGHYCKNCNNLYASSSHIKNSLSKGTCSSRTPHSAPLVEELLLFVQHWLGEQHITQYSDAAAAFSADTAHTGVAAERHLRSKLGEEYRSQHAFASFDPCEALEALFGLQQVPKKHTALFVLQGNHSADSMPSPSRLAPATKLNVAAGFAQQSPEHAGNLGMHLQALHHGQQQSVIGTNHILSGLLSRQPEKLGGSQGPASFTTNANIQQAFPNRAAFAVGGTGKRVNSPASTALNPMRQFSVAVDSSEEDIEDSQESEPVLLQLPPHKKARSILLPSAVPDPSSGSLCPLPPANLTGRPWAAKGVQDGVSPRPLSAGNLLPKSVREPVLGGSAAGLQQSRQGEQHAVSARPISAGSLLPKSAREPMLGSSAAGLQQSTIDKRPLPSSGWDNSAILQPDNAGVSILDGAAAGLQQASMDKGHVLPPVGLQRPSTDKGPLLPPTGLQQPRMDKGPFLPPRPSTAPTKQSTIPAVPPPPLRQPGRQPTSSSAVASVHGPAVASSLTVSPCNPGLLSVTRECDALIGDSGGLPLAVAAKVQEAFGALGDSTMPATVATAGSIPAGPGSEPAGLAAPAVSPDMQQVLATVSGVQQELADLRGTMQQFLSAWSAGSSAAGMQPAPLRHNPPAPAARQAIPSEQPFPAAAGFLAGAAPSAAIVSDVSCPRGDSCNTPAATSAVHVTFSQGFLPPITAANRALMFAAPAASPALAGAATAAGSVPQQLPSASNPASASGFAAHPADFAALATMFGAGSSSAAAASQRAAAGSSGNASTACAAPSEQLAGSECHQHFEAGGQHGQAASAAAHLKFAGSPLLQHICVGLGRKVLMLLAAILLEQSAASAPPAAVWAAASLVKASCACTKQVLLAPTTTTASKNSDSATSSAYNNLSSFGSVNSRCSTLFCQHPCQSHNNRGQVTSHAGGDPGSSSSAGHTGGASGVSAAGASAGPLPPVGRGQAQPPVGGSGPSGTGPPGGGPPGGHPAAGAATAYNPPGGRAGQFLLLGAQLINFNGCGHGPQCRRCLALAALQAELGIDAQYPIDMPQEAWLGRLGDLDDDQLFAVATAVLAIARYVVARRQELPVQATHVHAFASAGCGKSSVLNTVAYLLHRLGITRTLQTCFSNRLLMRLYAAEATLEALLGVAFRWEAHITAALSTIQHAFAPSYAWFYQTFFQNSRLAKEFTRGVTGVALDEAFTVHPLVMSSFIRFCEEYGIAIFLVGEALQITSKQDQRYLDLNWHHSHAFLMAPWTALESSGRMLYVQLNQNHRLPLEQFKMLCRFGLGGDFVLDADLQFLDSLGPNFPPGTRYITLFYNADTVREHNRERRDRLPGQVVWVQLSARLRPAAHQLQSWLPAAESHRLLRSAMEAMMARLHQDSVPAHQGGLNQSHTQFMSSTDLDKVSMGLKIGIPVFICQRSTARVWSLHTPTQIWSATGNTVEIEPGQLGRIVDILPLAGPALSSWSGQRVLGSVGINHIVVLAELDREGGPVVQVPVVSNTVSLVGLAGSTWNVDVQYLPVRVGWATTVQATQGLEFPHVLLDLNRAEWLEGGGYSGVGRVKGDLRNGLRILGGFGGNRGVFAANTSVLKWYLESVLPSIG